jgi:hypothetical protein
MFTVSAILPLIHIHIHLYVHFWGQIYQPMMLLGHRFMSPVSVTSIDVLFPRNTKIGQYLSHSIRDKMIYFFNLRTVTTVWSQGRYNAGLKGRYQRIGIGEWIPSKNGMVWKWGNYTGMLLLSAISLPYRVKSANSTNQVRGHSWSAPISGRVFLSSLRYRTFLSNRNATHCNPLKIPQIGRQKSLARHSTSNLYSLVDTLCTVYKGQCHEFFDYRFSLQNSSCKGPWYIILKCWSQQRQIRQNITYLFLRRHSVVCYWSVPTFYDAAGVSLKERRLIYNSAVSLTMQSYSWLSGNIPYFCIADFVFSC